MRRFVIGDIHGRNRALEQCFERSGFNNQEDLLICLGDVCDRGPGVKESFDLLRQIRHLVYILGNHDKWFLEWTLTGKREIPWTAQGGNASIRSYHDQPVPENHIQLLRSASLYYVLENKLFVHAGIDPEKSLEEQTEYDLLWSRELVHRALSAVDDPDIEKVTSFEEVFVGHTPTINYGFNIPVFLKGVWLMDTGAGWWGRLSIMDIDTGEYWQSDPVSER
ncbi:MAG: serine/threonine protein phosphatase [Bacteroidales bacterium]|nr:serine/threonine protein phosphatase [Bacteroidales bacterium]